MIDFNYVCPTKIYFGNDKHKQIGLILKEYNFLNIAFVYGQGSIKKNNIYDDIIFSLKENNINYYEISGVSANPKLSFVIKAKEFLKNKKIDLLLAVGGGSVIDTCKLLSHSLNYDGNPFDFNLKIAKPTKTIPVGVILTIAAAGSEMSDSCVISNDLTIPYQKLGFNCDSNRPLFAIMNPTLTFTVNKFQTACGICDILMHTLERFMNYQDNSQIADNLAIGLLKNVLYYGKIAINEPTNYEARAQLMICSSLSHNGLTNIGKRQFMRVHGLEHILSGFYDEVAHGQGLAILWPAWSYKVLTNPKGKKLLTIIAKELFNEDDPIVGIDKLKEYFKDIGLKTSLKELNLSKPLDIEAMALAYSKNKTINITDDFIDLNYYTFKEIFNLAL